MPNPFQPAIFNLYLFNCYRRRVGLLLVEAGFAFLLFLTAVFIAKPVFLTPLQDEPEPPLASADLLASLPLNNILGYAPNVEPYTTIMDRVSVLLGVGN